MGKYHQSKTKCQLPAISQTGFTLIELIVVIGIMALMSTIVLVGYNRERPIRNLRLATDGVVTTIREAQSYALSSQDLDNTTPVQYYALVFDASSSPFQYRVQALYNVNNPPIGTAGQLQTVQTASLPQQIKLTGVEIIPANGAPVIPSPDCLIIAFKLPFAEMITSSSCSNGDTNSFLTTDSYGAITQFISGTTGTVVDDASVILTLDDTNNTLPPQQILIDGPTGVVCPTQNGTTCQANY